MHNSILKTGFSYIASLDKKINDKSFFETVIYELNHFKKLINDNLARNAFCWEGWLILSSPWSDRLLVLAGLESLLQIMAEKKTDVKWAINELRQNWQGLIHRKNEETIISWPDLRQTLVRLRNLGITAELLQSHCRMPVISLSGLAHRGFYAAYYFASNVIVCYRYQAAPRGHLFNFLHEVGHAISFINQQAPYCSPAGYPQFRHTLNLTGNLSCAREGEEFADLLATFVLGEDLPENNPQSHELLRLYLDQIIAATLAAKKKSFNYI